jgi:adenylate cyclase
VDEVIDREIAKAQQAAERWLGGFVCLIAALFVALNAVQVGVGSTELGSRSGLGVASLYLVIYARVWWLSGSRPPTAWEVRFRTVLEVSVPLLMSLVDGTLGADYALPRVSAVVWAFAIFASTIRFRPELALLAGGVAAVEWLGLWMWLAPGAAPGAVYAKVGPAVNRAGLFLACGVLAWRVSAMQAGLTGASVRTALERERVRRAFGAYLPEPIVQRILAGELRLGTERRPVTVLFVDIRGFTRFAEGRGPEQVVEVLNRALEAFSAEVRLQGGFVNKYLGDGLMAIFGAPAEQEDHAAAAVRAAVAIAAAATRLGEQGVYPGLRIGVGLHCGDVVVGDIGGGGYREYTAIGDVVNVASRVEAFTKQVDAVVLATESVRLAAGEAARFEPLGASVLRGREGAVELWHVRAKEAERSVG